jgi:hypothetical protein
MFHTLTIPLCFTAVSPFGGAGTKSGDVKDSPADPDARAMHG